MIIKFTLVVKKATRTFVVSDGQEVTRMAACRSDAVGVEVAAEAQNGSG